MAPITSTKFVVLINGSPTSFFGGTRGLHQGCPMSHILFLPVAEGLRRCILKAKDEMKIQGINIYASLYITHILFVDDVIIFGGGTYEERG